MFSGMEVPFSGVEIDRSIAVDVLLSSWLGKSRLFAASASSFLLYTRAHDHKTVASESTGAELFDCWFSIVLQTYSPDAVILSFWPLPTFTFPSHHSAPPITQLPILGVKMMEMELLARTIGFASINSIVFHFDTRPVVLIETSSADNFDLFSTFVDSFISNNRVNVLPIVSFDVSDLCANNDGNEVIEDENGADGIEKVCSCTSPQYSKCRTGIVCFPSHQYVARIIQIIPTDLVIRFSIGVPKEKEAETSTRHVQPLFIHFNPSHLSAVQWLPSLSLESLLSKCSAID